MTPPTWEEDEPNYLSDVCYATFRDGYCDCRCGPQHHRLFQERKDGPVMVSCSYHRQLCHEVWVPKVAGFENGMFLRLLKAFLPVWCDEQR